MIFMGTSWVRFINNILEMKQSFINYSSPELELQREIEKDFIDLI